MILSGMTIFEEVLIDPFRRRTVHAETGMSYGLSIAGYDVRIREPVNLPTGGFILGSILEHITMPNDVIGIVHDKSTLARLGLALQNTVLECGWRGYLTVEISNHGNDLVSLPAGSPIAQIIFHRVDRPCEPYTGKYNDQPARPVGALREEAAE
jgi:dCTP deaminase